MTPYFQNFHDFIHMGGHGVYVWASYAISMVCLVGLIWQTLADRKKTIKQLRQKTTKLTNKQRQQLNKNTST